jgi:transcription-repair coupling factor (superfamily II helicase)
MGEIKELAESIDAGRCPAAITGAGSAQRAHIFAALRESTGRPLVVVCADERECERAAADIESLTGEKSVMLPAREFQLRTTAAASREWEQRRIAALSVLASGKAKIITATGEALLQRTIPKKTLDAASFTLRVGGSYALSELSDALARAGYSRSEQVEGVGQFAMRGGILDVFSPGMELPVRCEFFDDEADSLGVFDLSTQRRLRNIRSARILPAAELLPDYCSGGRTGLAKKLAALARRSEKKESLEKLRRTLAEDAERFEQNAFVPGEDRYFAAVYPDAGTAADYLPEDAVVCVGESSRVAERLKNYSAEQRDDAETLMTAGLMAGEWARLTETPEALWERLGDFPVCMAESLPTSRYPLRPRTLVGLTAKQLSSYGGSLDAAIADIQHYVAENYRVAILCGGEMREKNMAETLGEHGITSARAEDGELPEPGRVALMRGALSAGTEYPTIRLAVLTEGQMLAPAKKKERAPRRKKEDNRQRIQSYADLSRGDLVVHAHHGVGRYEGIFRMPVDGVEKDYVKIAYAGGDCLYVPATQLDLVSKYIGGGEEGKARLNRLGGTDWERAKTRAKAAAKDLAQGLIKLYAERQRLAGHAFAPDSPWQEEFEEAFEYQETDDQLRCIREIKEDMEKPTPMDRLLCGDVGYGKTEVALRAVMKCVLDGKQAAILVPTTVLAQQHYSTATNRFRRFPVNIAVLSRFQTPKESKKILSELRSGSIDILIGTHRLLQKGIEFKDLGLLIIDEEQRFGVTHKEKLREMAKQVDTLTLTATPIPRTLNMALSGIRSMSVIEMPPSDRQPVQTYVIEHDWGVVGDAMRRETARGGQVYYLHNRVETIGRTAARIQEMLGSEVSVAVAHGKMDEKELSEVMRRVVEGEAQVLVCTTIIETGIDIPNVNTMIIEDADNLGLAQLHQLRGRIGRSSRRAFAYLTYRKGKVLTEVANKRLSAIREYVEFGSGFRIAMRDLEIRGAGNLLGPEQSGYMMSVGYDMYLSLLEEAVLEEQGKKKEIYAECSADLAVSANIPEKYVPSSEQRMDLYRRIAAIRTPDDADDLLDELTDRYGEPPKAVCALLDVAMLRADAARGGITDIAQSGDSVALTFAEADLEAMSEACALREFKGRLRFLAGDKPRLALRVSKNEDVLGRAGELARFFADRRTKITREKER